MIIAPMPLSHSASRRTLFSDGAGQRRCEGAAVALLHHGMSVGGIPGRIGIDGYNLALPHGTGVATYATELVDMLHAMGHEVDGLFGLEVPADPATRQAVFFDRYRRLPDPPARIRRWRRPWRKARQCLRAIGPHPARQVDLDDRVVKADDGVSAIPRFDRLFSAGRLFEDAMLIFSRTGRFTSVRLPTPPDVMHWTYPLPLTVAGARNVYTLHDLVPLKLPYTTADDKESYARLIRGCIHHASQICTVSESSRSDILDQFGLKPSEVTVTYQTGTLHDVTTTGVAGDAAAIESIFGFGHRGYFLYYGAIEPKKNVGRLVEAYLMLRTATPLVIVGSRGWMNRDELALIPGEGANGASGTFTGPCGQTIVRLDYLSRDLLAKLVQGAKAVVFPSLYEGFGLPVLEAMQRGTPVITSSISSLPEVAGDAALLVDPYDVEALREAMRLVDGDDALARGMGVRGREQAERFSRTRYQERLVELYRAAMAS